MDYRNTHKHSFGGIKRHSIHKRRANNLSITDQTQAEWIKKQLKTKVTHCNFMKACRNFNLPESVSICPYLAPYWFLSLAPWRHIWGFHLQKWILINEKENDEKKKKSIIFQDHQVWKCWADKEKNKSQGGVSIAAPLQTIALKTAIREKVYSLNHSS